MNKTLLEMVKEVIERLDKMVDKLDERRNGLRKEYKKLYDETIRLEDILDNETFEDETRRRKLASELDIVDGKRLIRQINLMKYMIIEKVCGTHLSI